jgi:hypothetical protein
LPKERKRTTLDLPISFTLALLSTELQVLLRTRLFRRSSHSSYPPYDDNEFFYRKILQLELKDTSLITRDGTGTSK